MCQCNKEIWHKQHYSIYDFDASQKIFEKQSAGFLLPQLNTSYKSGASKSIRNSCMISPAKPSR